MPRMLQITFGVSIFMCVATSVLSAEGSHSAVRSTELLRKLPKENIQERFLETAPEDGKEYQSGEEEKANKLQEMKPPLVLKLLKEKLDTNPITNHLGTYLVPSPVPFVVSEKKLYYSHSATTAPEEPEPELPIRQLEEVNAEVLKQPPPKYQYIYKVKDPEGNDFGHSEARVGDHTWGRYFVQLPDGREKTVHYWADDSGFHAEVVYTGKSPIVHQ